MTHPRRWQRGLTLVETLSAATAMTIFVGALGTLLVSARNTFWANITLTQLSGYVDASTEQLKQDIWQASNATTGSACPNSGPMTLGTSRWLCLDMTPSTPMAPPQDGDVRYVIQQPPAAASAVKGTGSTSTAPPPNPRLLRQVLTAGAWQTTRVMAQYVVPAATTVTVTPASVSGQQGKLVRFNLQVQRSGGLGTPVMQRRLINAEYRLQTPTN